MVDRLMALVDYWSIKQHFLIFNIGYKINSFKKLATLPLTQHTRTQCPHYLISNISQVKAYQH